MTDTIPAQPVALTADMKAFERAEIAAIERRAFSMSPAEAWRAGIDYARRNSTPSDALDTEYVWLIDGEWQGSSTSARECLRYIEQYRHDGELEVTRIVTYPMTLDELHAIAAQEKRDE